MFSRKPPCKNLKKEKKNHQSHSAELSTLAARKPSTPSFRRRFQLQTLYKYIEQKGDLQEVAPLLTSLTKQKTAVTQLAKQGLKDLEELTVLLRKLGVKLQVFSFFQVGKALCCVSFFCPLTRVSPPCSQVVINLGLVYKVQHHCGVIFQFVAFVRKRKGTRTVPDIVAAGGRYDHLVGFPSGWCGSSSGGGAS